MKKEILAKLEKAGIKLDGKKVVVAKPPEEATSIEKYVTEFLDEFLVFEDKTHVYIVFTGMTEDHMTIVPKADYTKEVEDGGDYLKKFPKAKQVDLNKNR